MSEPTNTRRPNIIFLFSDQHRHDALGCAGNPVIQTPHLDRMAAEGVRFTRTYCQSPVCQPSRASVITGQYVHQHGISRNFAADFDPGWPTMMKKLQEAGYRTAMVGKTHFHTPGRGRKVDPSGRLELDLRDYEPFVRSFGFDDVLEEFDRYYHGVDGVVSHYTEHLRQRGVLEPYREQIRSVWRLTPHHWDGVTSVLSQEDDLTSFLADRAIDWLKRYDGQAPFFLMVGFVQPHVPLMDDPVWAGVYRDVEIPLGPRQPPVKPNEVWGAYLERLFKHSNSHLLTDEYVRNGARHYYGMVSLIDQRIGDILGALNERGWAGETWVFYSSDHGEMLGDHNLMAKMNFYSSSVLVPAIIRPPAGMRPKTRHVDGIVESIDITATILDVAGAGALEESAGRSLLPWVEGGGAAREAVFSAIEGGGGCFVMAVTDRYRYTMERKTGTPCELFDLKEDPDELYNLVNDPQYKGIVEDMRRDYILPHLESGKTKS